MKEKTKGLQKGMFVTLTNSQDLLIISRQMYEISVKRIMNKLGEIHTHGTILPARLLIGVIKAMRSQTEEQLNQNIEISLLSDNKQDVEETACH